MSELSELWENVMNIDALQPAIKEATKKVEKEMHEVGKAAKATSKKSQEVLETLAVPLKEILGNVK